MELKKKMEIYAILTLLQGGIKRDSVPMAETRVNF